jgi:hypothetical protein
VFERLKPVIIATIKITGVWRFVDCVLVPAAAVRGPTPADQLFRPGGPHMALWTNGRAAAFHTAHPSCLARGAVWRLRFLNLYKSVGRKGCRKDVRL